MPSSGRRFGQYKVRVPLWEEKVVVVDFQPDLASGAFYFPAVKDQRVLLLFDFDRARIHRFLDWRPGAKVPLDGQGNRLVLGLGETDRTTLTHDYVDDLPVFTLRREKDTDTATLLVEEGRMVLRVEEEEG